VSTPRLPLLLALVLIALALAASSAAAVKHPPYPASMRAAFTRSCVPAFSGSLRASIKGSGQKISLSARQLKRISTSYCSCALTHIEASVTLKQFEAYSLNITRGRAQSPKVQRRISAAARLCSARATKGLRRA